MTTMEIILLIVGALFTIVVILVMLRFDLKKFFKWLFKGGEKKDNKNHKEKKAKPPKEKKVKEKKVKEKKDKSKADKKEKNEEEKSEEKTEEKKPRAFQITKKGVVRIKKDAIDRDSRSGAIIEQAIKREDKKPDEKSKGFEDFDDFLEKLKSIGDPDDLDDDEFDELFLSNKKKNGRITDEELDDLLSDDFVSSESPAIGKIDRRLKHYTIDGSHLRLDKTYIDYPSRMPTLDMDHFVFTDRITGKYDNIKMGDVSNVLKPPEEKQEDPEEKEEDSDEEIFAKIMERRRRELGLDEPPRKELKNNNDGELDMRSIIIADMIMNPVSKKNNRH